METLHSISDVARALDVSQTSVRAWIRDKIIPQPEFTVGQTKAYTAELALRIGVIIKERRLQRAKPRTEWDNNEPGGNHD